MAALNETASTAIAYDSLNSTLAETGWRTELVADEQGGEKILYFPLTEAEFLHPAGRMPFAQQYFSRKYPNGN